MRSGHSDRWGQPPINMPDRNHLEMRCRFLAPVVVQVIGNPPRQLHSVDIWDSGAANPLSNFWKYRDENGRSLDFLDESAGPLGVFITPPRDRVRSRLGREWRYGDE